MFFVYQLFKISFFVCNNLHFGEFGLKLLESCIEIPVLCWQRKKWWFTMLVHLSLGAVCFMVLLEQVKPWWLELWLTNVPKEKERLLSLCGKEQTVSASGLVNLNGSFGSSLIKLVCKICDSFSCVSKNLRWAVFYKPFWQKTPSEFGRVKCQIKLKKNCLFKRTGQSRKHCHLTGHC